MASSDAGAVAGCYTIRPAQVGDLDGLVELHLALQDHLERANPDVWRMSARGRASVRAQLAARLRAPGSYVLVAEHDQDGIIGAVSGRTLSNPRYVPSRAGAVDQLFVRREHRRRKVASRLMFELCRLFAEQGVEQITLRYVHGNVEAAHFWAALGFCARLVTVGASRSEVEGRLSSLGVAA